MKRVFLSVAAVLIGAACSDSHPPGSDSAIYTPPGSGGDAGTLTDASANPDGYTTGDGGDVTDAGADAPPPVLPDSVCNPSMSVGAAVAAVSTGGDDRFGSVTGGDELTIAWTVPSGGSATLQIADRLAIGDAFGTPQSAAGLVALDGVALSPTGLTLVAVAEDKRSFVVFERATRSDAFAAANADNYAPLVAGLGVSDKVGDPVFAQGGQLFVYSQYGTSDDTVRFANRFSLGSPFVPSGALAITELRAQSGKRRRPSGAGYDRLTLFYWDEVSGTEKIGRFDGDTKFSEVHDLGAHAFAQPNDDCTRIYFRTPGTGGSDIVSAPVQ